VEVREALDRAQGSVKVAVLLLQGCDLETARAALEKAGGQLRRAMELVAQDRAGEPR
jgi:N-acetylmuramic acid 6-phosphate etherase